jgi:hypothetical protein
VKYATNKMEGKSRGGKKKPKKRINPHQAGFARLLHGGLGRVVVDRRDGGDADEDEQGKGGDLDSHCCCFVCSRTITRAGVE